MLLVYFGAFMLFGFIVAIIAMIATMFIMRATRPRADGPPPRR
jgi:hypothetical protein